MGKNIKDGDRVYYKIKSGEIRTGKYEEKTKSVKLANGKTAKPPMVALFKQKSTAEKNPYVKLTGGKVGYEEPVKPKKGRPAGRKTAPEKIKGDKRRKTGKFATEKKETPKPKPKATTKSKKEYTFSVYLPTDYSNYDALDYFDDKKSDFSYTEDYKLPKVLTTVRRVELGTQNTYHRFQSKKKYSNITAFKKAFPDAPTKYTNEFGDSYGYTGGIVKET